MTAPRDPQEQLGEAIRVAAGGVRAPEALRARIERRRVRRTRAWTWRLAGAAGAAAGLAAILLLAGGGPPSVREVAAAALRPPTAPAPAADPRDDRFIAVTVGGVRFPDYQRPWGWTAVGARRDEVDGRRAVTVIYRRGELGAHYTVVDGAPLPLPEGARSTRVGGVRVHVLRDGDARVVTWRRGGHTCVLASRLVDTEQLLRLVAWR